MSQTPTQRAREIADARRRNISAVIDHQAARAQPRQHDLGYHLVAALPLFGADELELLESLLPTCAQTRAPLAAIAAVISRLLLGLSTYGELVLDSDPRDFARERDEELVDAVIYESMELLLLRHDGADVTAPTSSPRELTALTRVGREVAERGLQSTIGLATLRTSRLASDDRTLQERCEIAEARVDNLSSMLRAVLADLVDRGYSTAEQQQLLREARAMVAT